MLAQSKKYTTFGWGIHPRQHKCAKITWVMSNCEVIHNAETGLTMPTIGLTEARTTESVREMSTRAGLGAEPFRACGQAPGSWGTSGKNRLQKAKKQIIWFGWRLLSITMGVSIVLEKSGRGLMSDWLMSLCSRNTPLYSVYTLHTCIFRILFWAASPRLSERCPEYYQIIFELFKNRLKH